ncbi:ankyrin repeat-containing domain protein [Protomyces lactucae-debilis]|uniref:Ankyrin repeat-containing domain protein n=1 Tax=Protomyces lactucae-debilis TaxID=2754530 RepID=A0A1Y2FDY0_PROLT|nr:ankyrin repeat-containing domain protein [Protomyces lactucae-debilis]ORY82138.1 ankyrin repeat-containing domain protein [Protomyces lactucae-debilis]
MASEEQGASPAQVAFGAARANNVDLLRSTLAEAPDCVGAKDALQNTPLHIAARSANLECVDLLLDMEDVPIDAQNMEGDTALHLAVRTAEEDKTIALDMVEFLIDAGAQASLRNKQGDLPLDCVPDKCQEIKDALLKADLAVSMAQDIVSLQWS